MSTIQTQLGIAHLESSLNASSAVQRTTVGSSFTSSSISVSTSDETIPLGDVTEPKQVLLKLVSGDAVKVGFSDSVYPMRLQDAGEGMLLRLDVEGIRETSTFLVTAENANTTLHQKYFTLSGSGGTWAVWFDVGGVGAEPSHGASSSVEITGIIASDTADTVGAAIAAELLADTAFAAEFDVSFDAATDLLTITDKFVGTRTDAAAGTSGFTANTAQSGEASPVVHLRSVGTSQVVVAVAPN